MSRSFGATLFTMRSPMRIVPSLIFFETGHHTQCRAFPTARRPDEHDKFPIANRQIDRIDGLHVAGINLGNLLEQYLSHVTSLESAETASLQCESYEYSTF